MVTNERKWMPVEMVTMVLEDKNKSPEEKLETLGNGVKNLPKRLPKPPAPKGGISLSEAERTYKIPNETISRWVKRGYIPVLLRTRREVYIVEQKIKKMADFYLKNGGRGSWAIKKFFN